MYMPTSRIMLAALLCACALADAGAAAAQVQAVADTAGYERSAIYAGDVIRLNIWREPDLSQSLTVPPDGVVIFPKIGAQQVAGRPLGEVRTTLLSAYREYLINPSIEIEVLRKVQVLGAVQKPGVYTVESTVSISDMLAIAGGVSPNGRQDRVELRRNDELIEVELLDQNGIADTPIRSGDQLYVEERPYLVRNTGMMAALLSGTIGLIIALFIR
ncbi:MAG: polysaccharide biosynthesis/export family protein [Gemmatimonadota bacterium]